MMVLRIRNQKNSKGKLLNTLIELHRLKRLDRTGWTLRGLPNGTESVAAHSFGVCVVAMFLADEMVSRGVDINTERLLRMALLHDWAEARVGDMPRTGKEYFGHEVTRNAEKMAFAAIVKNVGAAETEYTALHDDYEQRNSLEARLVKTADIIDLLLQAFALEKAGAKGLDEFWEAATSVDFELTEVGNEIAQQLVQSLLAARIALNQQNGK